jgi:hypothetical protein
LDFPNEGEDIDFGYHSEWEWPKSLTRSNLRSGPCRRCVTYRLSTTYDFQLINIFAGVCQVFFYMNLRSFIFDMDTICPSNVL